MCVLVYIAMQSNKDNVRYLIHETSTVSVTSLSYLTERESERCAGISEDICALRSVHR